MKLFNRQKDDPGTAVQPSVEELLGQEAVEGQRRVDWRRTIPRLLATLVVIAIIAVGSLWAFGVFDDDKSKDKPEPTKTAQNDNKQPDGADSGSGSGQAPANPQPAAPAGGDTNTSGNSSGSSAPSGTGSGAATGTASPQAAADTSGGKSGEQLAASGPTETITVFVLASAAGILFYQTKLRYDKKYR